jgi:hypothetical protein
VRLLLDENLPHDPAAILVGHQVDTVAGRGWAGIQNGELLAKAQAEYGAFLTMDRRLPQQQNVSRLSLGVVLIQAPSNRMVDLRPLVAGILAALGTLTPGTLVAVGA